MNMPKQLFILILLVLGIITACDQATTPANEVVLSYLQSLVEGDADSLRSLSCASLESGAIARASSFASVDASVEDAVCTVDGTDGDFTRVTCTGDILFVYGTGEDAVEERLPLTSYRTIQENGEWRFCGEAETSE